MAKNFRCWVIVVGAEPTAFRAKLAEDLLPTLKQLQRTQPDVAMKWFERGRVWASPEAATAALKERRTTGGGRTGRGRDWRPGGDHKDPRAKYEITRDEKRARFKKRLVGKNTRSTSRDSAFEDRPASRPPSRPAWRQSSGGTSSFGSGGSGRSSSRQPQQYPIPSDRDRPKRTPSHRTGPSSSSRPDTRGGGRPPKRRTGGK